MATLGAAVQRPATPEPSGDEDRKVFAADLELPRGEGVAERERSFLGPSPSPRSEGSRSHELHAGHSRKLLLCDSLVVIGAVVAADIIRPGRAADAASAFLGFPAASFVLVALWMMFLGMSGSRSRRVVGHGLEEYTNVVLTTLQFFGLIAIAASLLAVGPANAYLSIALPLGLTGLLASRFLCRRVAYARRRRGQGVVTALVVGNPEAAASLATMFASEPEAGYQVVAACTPDGPTPLTPALSVGGRDIPIVGVDTAILSAVRRTGVSTVAVAATDVLTPTETRRLIWELDALGVELMMVPGLFDIADHRLRTRLIGGMAVLEVDTPQYHRANSTAKRVFDVVFAAAALIVGLPVLIAAAIAVKLSSRGPVFYAAERVGLNGERFSMYKFRTMCQGADAMVADMIAANGGDPLFFKVKDDPRITRVGRLLRKFSIDELPQLLNVLVGHMSIVGPRPQVQREVDSYDDLMRNRLAVKPGLTGLWQISGRSDLKADDAVRLDLDYVENWSLLRDLMITVKTVKTVLTARGAY